jgi:spore coat protein U-like protein
MIKKAVRIVVLVLALLALTQIAYAGTATAPLFVSATVLSKSRISSLPELSSAQVGAGSKAISDAAANSVSISATKGVSYRVFIAGPSAEAGAQNESRRFSHVTIEW